MANKANSNAMVRAVHFIPGRPSAKGREKEFPNQIQLGLHVLMVRRHHNHGVLGWEDDAKLALHSVAPKRGVAATPELEPVTLVPITRRIASIGSLAGSRHLDPGGGNQLLSF